MPTRQWAALAPCLAIAIVLAGGAAAADLKFAPHRAVYDLSLARSDPTGAVTSLRGRLVMEFNDVCEGYTLNQRIRTEAADMDGNARITDFTISSWESRDGKRFRFNLHNEVDGQLVEDYAGKAELTPEGGTVEMTKPEEQSIKLPPGTVFPTEHLGILIRDGRAGKEFASVSVFDGAGEGGVYKTGAHIGKPIAPETAKASPLAQLKGLASWPVRIAYFPRIDHAETPDYEIGLRLFENGISGDLVLDYGDFAMKGALVKLDLLPDPGC